MTRENRIPRVVVSGAAGVAGFACASALAARGAELILCDSDGAGLARAREEVGGYARFCDVASDACLEIFAADVAHTFSSIDILINAAGDGYVRSLGMIRMTQALLPLLRKAGGPRLILNIAPLGGFTSSDPFFPHAGSRKGFERLSAAIAEQVKGTSIGVLMIMPRLKPNRRGSAEGSQLYRLERVDADELAERIVSIVRERLPQWRPELRPRIRRA